MEKLNEQIGTRVCLLRRSQGLTQEQLSEMLDCSVQFLSMVERGQRGMSLRMLCTCAHAFRVSADELLGMETLTRTEKPGNTDLHLLDGCNGFERKMVLDVVEAVMRNLREIQL